MTEPKFTPGPWELWNGRVEANDDVCVVSLEDIGGHDDGVIVANAHLIAAAPTMADYVRRKAADGCEEAARIWEQINAC